VVVAADVEAEVEVADVVAEAVDIVEVAVVVAIAEDPRARCARIRSPATRA
jgi:hypothetical protein